MRIALVALISGLLTVRFLGHLPSGDVCLWLASIGFILIFSRIFPIGFLLLGIAWGCFCAICVMNDRLDKKLDGQKIWLVGEISGLPEQDQQLTRFYVKNSQTAHSKLPKLIRLSWYQAQPIMPGEKWRFWVTLKYPKGTVNPATFDYEAWLTSKHVGATGTVKQAERLERAGLMAGWRHQLRATILAQNTYGQGGGLVALVIGDGSGISQTQWDILQATGTIHLMVVSGQHITLLAALIYGSIAWLARIGWWPKRLNWLPVACAMAMVGAVSYGYLAGFDIPVQRSCIMLAIVLLWRLKFRQLGIITPFLSALAIVLIYDPLASLQAGFWLSFVSVAILLIVFAGRLQPSRWWINAFKLEWVISIGLTPVLMALLLPVSLTGPIANLVAVPIVTFIIVPLALLGTLFSAIPYLGSALLWLAGASLHYLFSFLAAMAQLVPAWIIPMPAWWAFILALLGVVILLLPSGIPIRLFGLVFCLPLLIPNQTIITKGLAKVTVFDVGQGLAVLVRTTEHTLLYDLGPSFGDFNLGARILLPSLQRQGISIVDKIIVSHADRDHIGALVPINERLIIKEILSGEVDRLPKELSIKPCLSGLQWTWDDVNFTLWQWSGATKSNDASCVLMVEAKGERLLLTGDISKPAEQAWLLNNHFTIDWLLVPHHGSKHSSSIDFLAMTKPHNAIISRGWLNAFHHPNEQVVNRYKALNTQLHDTAITGALHITLGAYLPVERQRDIKYFWRK